MCDPPWSDGEQDAPDGDDLHNWVYYTENFDTEVEDSRPHSYSGEQQTTDGSSHHTLHTSVASGAHGISSHDICSMDYQCYARAAAAAAAAVVPSTTPNHETLEKKSPHLHSTLFPSDYHNAAATEPTACKSDLVTDADVVQYRYTTTPRRRPKSVFDASGDDSLSPLPLNHAPMRSSPNPSSIAPLPMAPAIFRIGTADPFEPPFKMHHATSKEKR
jgi:hypothetical protein